MSFWPIFKKNLNVMFNSKLALLILIFGPLFLMGITGAALQNNELREVGASVFAYDGLSGEVLDDWYVDGYKEELVRSAFVVSSAQSLRDCKDAVLNSKSHVCIEIVKNPAIEVEGLDISQDINYENRAHVDFSKSRIVWGVIGKTQAASERHKNSLARGLFTEYKDKIGEPADELRLVRNKLNDLSVPLATLETKLGNIQGAQSNMNLELGNLESSIEKSTYTIDSVISTVNSIPGLEPSVYVLVSGLNGSHDNVRREFNSLNSLIGSSGIGAYAGEGRALVNKMKNEIRESRDDIEEVIREVEEVSNLDYTKLTPPPFEYKSVNEDDPLRGSISGARKLEFLDYLFPSFLMFFIVFVSLVFSAVTTFKERSSRAHIRNITSRTDMFSFILGNFASIFIVLAFQILIILGVSVFFLQASILGNFAPLIIYSLLGIFLFTLLGMALAYIFNSQDGSVISSVSLSLLFLIFLPIITAPETLPPFFAKIVGAMPFVILEGKLRMASIFNIFSWPSIAEFLSIGIFFLISVFLIFYFYVKRERYELS